MNRRALVLLVAALALLSGCGGFGGSGDAGPTPTVTPVPPPEPTAPIVPGVYDDAVNGTAVVAAHHAALANRSFTLRRTLETRADGAVRYRQVADFRVGAGGVPLAASQNFSFRSGGVATYAIWYDGNRTAIRQRAVDGTVTLDSYAGPPPVDPTGRDLLSSLFASFEVYDVTPVEGGARLGGAVTRPAAIPQPSSVGSLHNVTMTALVDERGVVERVAIGYDTTYRDTPIHVRFTMRVSRIGSTSVATPGWTEHLPATTPTPRTPVLTPAPNGTATPASTNGTATAAAPNGTVATSDSPGAV
ncbi:MAG: hypothetical protein ABEJ89_10670 [Haloarculaceae archaeon]